MDFFKSGLKSVLGSPEPGVQPTGAETVNTHFIYFIVDIRRNRKEKEEKTKKLCHKNGHKVCQSTIFRILFYFLCVHCHLIVV